ncbi:MAG: ATP-dependent Clp protease ATP-binding subunit [Candidatus Magasanikbacteria bacterium]
MPRKHLLYWGMPMTRYHIRLRKARRGLQKGESIAAVLVGLLFFGLFGWFIYRSNEVLDVFTLFYWRTTGNGTQALFWLAITAFSFVIYRRVSLRKDPVHVEPYEETPTDVSELESNKINSWDGAKKVPRSKRLDIADVFTEEAHNVMEAVFDAADTNGSTRLLPEHVFYGLLTVQSVRNLFIRLGIPVKQLQEIILKGFEGKQGQNEPLFSEEFIQILFHSYELAYEDRQDFVHVTELLISTVAHSERLQELLYDLEIDKQKLTNVVEWLRIRERLKRQYQELQSAAMHRSKYGLDRAMTAVATPYLNRFSQDVTMAAKYGRLAPCVARDAEIDEIFRIIEGGRQSVLLVGDRGAGKMSIIEGIAQLMVEDKVPERLKDKRLVQLSTSALLAGTTVSGAQERLINMMNEIAKAGNVILFIRNIQDLAGAGSTGGGAGLDVTETLAEYLGGGQFLSFATTTSDGFNQHIVNTEVGSVLGRVDVNIMDENQSIQVLESKAGHLEYKHRVFFSYNALEQAVRLAEKYLHDQNLPESAIGVVTEAASVARGKRGEDSLVSAEDVAQIISSKTGIPATSISEEESKKLLRLEDEMHKRVVGQDEAVKLVANALRRARAEIRSQKRPIANFLFLGPTGVGKTELAKTIASVYFGGEERMIRIDMSEYQDKSGVYRLIGQPGQQGTGILTEAVRQNPFSLVLLDEMEKADPDILNLFLQVFDDGRLTDSVGRVIDFTNAIIIATSNAGTNYVQKQISAGVPLEQIREEIIRGELKKYYRPEFLNRFDGIVLFKSLERAEIKHIAKLMLTRVARDLEERGIFLRTEEPALEALADAGFDPEFGARPLRRAIQDLVENRLAELILENKLNRRDTVVLGPGLEMRIER